MRNEIQVKLTINDFSTLSFSWQGDDPLTDKEVQVSMGNIGDYCGNSEWISPSDRFVLLNAIKSGAIKLAGDVILTHDSRGAKKLEQINIGRSLYPQEGVVFCYSDVSTIYFPKGHRGQKEYHFYSGKNTLMEVGRDNLGFIKYIKTYSLQECNANRIITIIGNREKLASSLSSWIDGNKII